jgi:hypothetical protein
VSAPAASADRRSATQAQVTIAADNASPSSHHSRVSAHQ